MKKQVGSFFSWSGSDDVFFLRNDVTIASFINVGMQPLVIDIQWRPGNRTTYGTD